MAKNNNFTIDLSPELWDVVDTVAKAKGYSSARKYITYLCSKMGTTHLEGLTCKGARKNKQRTFQIPPHASGNFAVLTCKLGKTASTLMTMALFAEILQFMQEPDA